MKRLMRSAVPILVVFAALVCLPPACRYVPAGRPTDLTATASVCRAFMWTRRPDWSAR